MIDLRKKKLFLIDLDGVFYKGKEDPIKIGGTELIGRIREKQKKLFVVTNNSTDTRETIHSNLKKLDLPIHIEEILTSACLTADFVREKYGEATYFLIGEAGLDQELRQAGLHRTLGTEADVVVIGLDRKLTYSKLDRASRVIENGAEIVASHSARRYMYKNGPALAVGPTLKALEYATQKRGTVIGKPSPLMLELALKRARCSKADAVMVGDQTETDILAARRAGIDSILVLSGVDNGVEKIQANGQVANIDDLSKYI